MKKLLLLMFVAFFTLCERCYSINLVSGARAGDDTGRAIACLWEALRISAGLPRNAYADRNALRKDVSRSENEVVQAFQSVGVDGKDAVADYIIALDNAFQNPYGHAYGYGGYGYGMGVQIQPNHVQLLEELLADTQNFVSRCVTPDELLTRGLRKRARKVIVREVVKFIHKIINVQSAQELETELQDAKRVLRLIHRLKI